MCVKGSFQSSGLWTCPSKNMPTRGGGRPGMFQSKSVGTETRNLDPVLVGNTDASEEVRKAARRSRCRRHQKELFPKNSMVDISNKPAADNNFGAAAWRECKPDSEKDLSTWKAHREKVMKEKNVKRDDCAVDMLTSTS
jgi:hypothetical protein